MKFKKVFSKLVMTLPSLIIIGVFWIVPIIIVFISSFFTNVGRGGMESEFTLENYINIFTDAFYFNLITRSFLIASGVTILCFIISYPVAYKLARMDKEKVNFFLVLIVTPFLTAFIFRAFGWVYILGNKGVINSILHSFGFEGVRLIWTRPSVIFVFANVLLPFMILSLYSSINQIDISIEEAAKVLGAGKIKTTIFIVFPMIKSGILTGCIFVFAIAIGTYEIPSIIGGTGELVFPTQIERYVALLNYPMGSALSVILFFFVIIVIYIFKKIVGGEFKL